MAEDKITLDRESFRALAADTRINLLKSLGERRKTLSELAKQHSLKPSTVKEHLDLLQSAELIAQKDEGYKWKYWELTRKGRSVVFPSETNVMIILGFSSIVFVGAIFLMMAGVSLSGVSMVAGNAAGDGLHSAQIAPEGSPLSQATITAAGEETVSDTTAEGRDFTKGQVSNGENLLGSEPQTGEWEASPPEGEAVGEESGAPEKTFPFAELAVAIIAAIVMGLCIGYLAKARARI